MYDLNRGTKETIKRDSGNYVWDELICGNIIMIRWLVVVSRMKRLSWYWNMSYKVVWGDFKPRRTEKSYFNVDFVGEIYSMIHISFADIVMNYKEQGV